MSEFEVPDAPIPKDGADPEAPYGRRKDGTPKAKPGPGPGRAGGNAARGRRATTARPRPSTAKTKTDYRPGIRGLFQLTATPLGLAGQRNRAALADAATLVAYADPIAEGLQDVSQHDPRVAAVLDRILQVGPYAAIIAPVIGLATQLAVNHKMIPVAVGQQMGAHDPDFLIASVLGKSGNSEWDEPSVSRETSANGTGTAHVPPAPEHEPVI